LYRLFQKSDLWAIGESSFFGIILLISVVCLWKMVEAQEKMTNEIFKHILL